MIGDEWAKDIKEIYGEYIEKYKLIPKNLITKLLMKLRIVKVDIRHFKVKNPLIEQLNKEINLWELLPKNNWINDLKGVYNTKNDIQESKSTKK